MQRKEMTLVSVVSLVANGQVEVEAIVNGNVGLGDQNESRRLD